MGIHFPAPSNPEKEIHIINFPFKSSENEPDMRRLLHFYTSWSAMEDSECELLAIPRSTKPFILGVIAVATSRVLTQALSNTVTANDALVARLWDSYMNLPEDQVVLMCVYKVLQDRRGLFLFIISQTVDY